MNCILCKHEHTKTHDKLVTADIVKLYSSWLDHDVSREFGQQAELLFLECPQCGLKFFYPTIIGSSDYYYALSKSIGGDYYLEEKSEYNLAAKFIENNDRILDIGSGRGLFSKYTKADYTGLDFNPQAIEQASQKGIRVINQSLEDHVKENQHSYSVITAFQVLEHVSDPNAFIEECLNGLKRGGYLIISVPSEDSYVPLQKNAILNIPPHHITRWSDNCLRNLSNMFGISLIHLEHEQLSPVHFTPFIRVLAQQRVQDILGIRNNKMIDTSLRMRIVNNLASKLMPFLSKLLANPSFWPYGHSVTAIYKYDCSD